ncbi:MAG: hypothetical protein A3H70_03660 [Candidatus Komeilibacteria bacterium RIFCSPLOWO2_02_FULL_48_11]|uniref:Short-chain dehydrogenase n=1 Tax=Candidatus Komeilibacteria bacterium RIFCSPLOWO2_02_FULL_48_11 TaxID=1798553 RepID=A0A1G2BNV8_9BACT|nr:MAG: hypothetical protein A3H70_03660 [Candidatus Komeilibacteria bacterium RIFCSPLOWO2_02_FULL_48_11]
MSKQNITLIAGAASSFGKVIIPVLFNKGHQLILTHSGREDYQLPEGVAGEVFKLDITDVAAITNVIGGFRSKINNLIYSVGSPIVFKKFEDEKWEDYEKHWQTQVKGLWHITRALIANNHPLKRVIAIGSAVTFTKPPARLGAYTTSKYALLGLIKSLAVELASRQIAVNMISPGATGAGLSKDWPRLMIEAGGSTDTRTVADTIALLLQEESGRTGENFHI